MCTPVCIFVEQVAFWVVCNGAHRQYDIFKEMKLCILNFESNSNSSSKKTVFVVMGCHSHKPHLSNVYTVRQFFDRFRLIQNLQIEFPFIH